jgi:hypothetical protein
MYFAEKVFDAKYNTSNEFPTPRIINRFVNAVAAAWLARKKDRFPIPIVSLFVANFDAIDRSILLFTQSANIDYFDSDYPDWRDQVAALYFGVPKDKSRQVLLEGPIRRSLDSGDVHDFKALLKYPGSFKVFDDIIRSYSYDPSRPEALDFAFKSAKLLACLDQASEGVRRAWLYLVTRILQIESLPSLSELSDNVRPFLQNLSGDLRRKFAARQTEWL